MGPLLLHVYGVLVGGGGGLQNFSVSSSTLGTNLVSELGTWLGLGLGGLRTKGLGPGLDNTYICASSMPSII